MSDTEHSGRVRLQKYLSECGVASRRAAETLIVEGKVKINEQIVTALGTTIDPVRDSVRVRNKIVRPAEKGVLLFHKPKEVVSTLSDPEGRKCIAHYLTKHYKSYFPVGRLDWESTGLVILTNDGELAERLLHPRYGYERVYEVRVSGQMKEKEFRRIEKGVYLDDGIARAKVQFISSDHDSTWVKLTITEGRNRIIRRLMKQIHHPVLKLKRIAHGPLLLGKLQPGEMKSLSQDEYEKLKKRVLARRIGDSEESFEEARPPRKPEGWAKAKQGVKRKRVRR